MDLQQLKVFQQAARMDGFTRAGEELHLSQSTVSLHIKRLEEELGCALFLRAKKRVYLNEAGRVLLQYADRILQELKNADLAVREMGNLQHGTIRFGSGATTLTYMLPKILGAFQRKYPQIELIVTTDCSERLAQAVHLGKLDMAVVMQPVQPALSIDIIPIFREELVYVIGNNHRIAAKEVLEPEDLCRAPFISFLQGSAMQAQVDRYFTAMNVTPPITMEMENIEAIKAVIRAGLGAAVLPFCSVAGSNGAMLRAMRLRGFPMERSLALALPGGGVMPRLVQRFANRLTKALSGKTVSEIQAERVNAA